MKAQDIPPDSAPILDHVNERHLSHCYEQEKKRSHSLSCVVFGHEKGGRVVTNGLSVTSACMYLTNFYVTSLNDLRLPTVFFLKIHFFCLTTLPLWKQIQLVWRIDQNCSAGRAE